MYTLFLTNLGAISKRMKSCISPLLLSYVATRETHEIFFSFHYHLFLESLLKVNQSFPQNGFHLLFT